MLKNLLEKVYNKKNLSIIEAKEALNLLTYKDTTESQIAAFLVALKSKGETIDEITGFAMAMRENALKINYTDNPLFDCCGTGGDMASTINVSTASAILASAGSVYIAKHSNKSITSISGSSDVLQELNIHLCINELETLNYLKKNNIAFLHAPSFHKSTRNVAKVRQEIGIRTIFNLLGPLTNPANLNGQLIGVSSPEYCPIIINVLKNLGSQKAMVVCANNPFLDEISLCGSTTIYELVGKEIKNYTIEPEFFGFNRVPIDKIRGGTPKLNAKIITEIFKNKVNNAKRETIVLNTAAILYIANKAETLKEGITKANYLLDSNKAYEKLISLQQNSI